MTASRRRVVFAQPAAGELEAAIDYYEKLRAGLGEELRLLVAAAAQRVSRWPVSFPIEDGTVRRLVLRRFPYKLLYAVEDEAIVIVALAHRRQRPGYWRERIEQP